MTNLLGKVIESPFATLTINGTILVLHNFPAIPSPPSISNAGDLNIVNAFNTT